MHLLPRVQFDHRSEQTQQARIKLSRNATFLPAQQTTHIHDHKERSSSLHLSMLEITTSEAWRDAKHLSLSFVFLMPAYLHPSEGLYVQRVVFKKLSKGSASSGIVTS